MTCPYSVPNCTADVAAGAQRCRCGGYLKRCPRCDARNRGFSNFCRACGSALPSSAQNWTAYKGSARRLGVSASARGPASLAEKVTLRLRLGDECRGLLAYDGVLVAISLSGVVEIADPRRAATLCRFQVQGPITAEPCIRNGMLYLGARGQLTAYALAPMTAETPRVQPAWQMPIGGTPIHALTAAGNRLFVTVASSGWRDIQLIDSIHRPQPVPARTLFGAANASWLAADATGRAVFFSEDVQGVQLHVFDRELTTHPVSLRALAEQPIALLGDTIFGVFGEEQRLYRIDAATGSIAEPLDAGTQLFALTHAGEDEWDRDGARIDTLGISFLRSGIHDSFGPHEWATRSSPLIVPGCAVVIGMDDGRVRVYGLAHLPRHEVWHVGDNSGAAITALASFETFLAAGNKEGIVEVRELRTPGAKK